MSLFSELKRRNVFKVGAAYLVLAWIVIQVADAAVPALHLPEWVNSLVFLLGLLGFPFALFFAWAFELTPEGIKKESEVERDESITETTGKKLEYSIIFLLVMALGYFIWHSQSKGEQTKQPPEITQSEQESLQQSTTKAENVATLPAAIYTPALGEKSIAVLPFENRSPDKNDAYFTEGIHDDLLTQLAKVNAFKVISRTSVMEYKNTTKNLKQIGEELGVATIMEGAVQRSGTRVRINVQLIDSRTDEHLWAEIYDRRLTADNLFDIQTEISKAIASALKTELSPETIKAVSNAPTQNLKAYELYLQANHFKNATAENELKTAIALYQHALQLDPKFKQAWTSLAVSQLWLYWFAQGNRSYIKLARVSLDKAIQIDPDFPELYIAEGRYFYMGFLNYDKAILLFDKALKSMPNNADAYMSKGWALRRAGHWQQAIENMQASLKLNPRSDFNWQELASTFQFLYRYSEAQTALDKAKSIDPVDYWTKAYLTEGTLHDKGDTKLAISQASGIQFANNNEIRSIYLKAHILARDYKGALSVIKQLPDSLEIWRQKILLREDYLAQVSYFQGNKIAAQQNARDALKRLEDLRNKLGDDYRLYLPQARMYAILGEKDKVKAFILKSKQASPADALTELERNYQYARSLAMAGLLKETIQSLEPQLSPPSDTSIAYVKLDPAFDQVRDKPEFKAMMARHQKSNAAKQEDNP